VLFDRLRRNSARNDRPTEYVDHVYEGEVVDEKPRYIPRMLSASTQVSST